MRGSRLPGTVGGFPADKVTMEQVIRALCGGAAPDVGDGIILGDDGWYFKNNLGLMKIIDNATPDAEFTGEWIELFKGLDVEASVDNIKIIPRANHTISTLTGTITLDYDNGGSQVGTCTGNTTFDGVNNFPDGGWMNFRIDAATYTLTFSGTYFEGPTLSFDSEVVVGSIVDFGAAKLTVIAGSF